MHLLYVVSVWLHILAVAVWLGGMVFFALVVVPTIRRTGGSAALVHNLGVRFRTVGWTALAVLVGTGIVNLSYRLDAWTDLVDPAYWSTPFGHVLAVKLALVGVILVISAVHDFFVGPRATRALQQAPDSASAAKLRRRASYFGRINLLLALVVAALGVMLVRGAPG